MLLPPTFTFFLLGIDYHLPFISEVTLPNFSSRFTSDFLHPIHHNPAAGISSRGDVYARFGKVLKCIRPNRATKVGRVDRPIAPHLLDQGATNRRSSKSLKPLKITGTLGKIVLPLVYFWRQILWNRMSERVGGLNVRGISVTVNHATPLMSSNS